MFRWVAAAKRPLSLMEIREAIAVEPCQPSSQQDKLVNDVYQLVPWCGNLLVLDEEEGLVQFAHHSVKDYLLSAAAPEISSHHFRIKLRDVDREAGEICCTYLHFSDFERQIIHLPQVSSGLDPQAIVKTSLSASSNLTMASSLLRLNALRKAGRATKTSEIWRQLHLTSLEVGKMWPQNLQTRYYFLAYASEYWLDHTNGFDENDGCWDLFRRLVLTENTTLAGKPWSIAEWKAYGAKVHNYILDTEHRALLSLAIFEQPPQARAHLVQMVRHKCSLRCSDEMLQFLVNATQWVEEFWSTWDRVLIIAAERRRLDWVKEVIKLAGGFESISAQNKAKNFNPARAEMDICLSQWWRSALYQAEWVGTNEMLDLLLTYEAIMLGGLKGRGYNELHAAASAGHVGLIRRLLDVRVDPNVVTPAPRPSFDTILAAAASGGSLPVVEELLDAGAEVNFQPVGFNQSALNAAAGRGNTLIVIALLAAGADVNANLSTPHQSPLAAAADHEDILFLLRTAGARTQDSAAQDLIRYLGHPERKEVMRRATQEAYRQTQPYQITTDENGEEQLKLSFKDRVFFQELKKYVKLNGRDMSSTNVKEAMAAFFEESLRQLGTSIYIQDTHLRWNEA